MGMPQLRSPRHGQKSPRSLPRMRPPPVLFRGPRRELLIPPPGAVLLFPGSSQPPVRFQPQNTILSSHAPPKGVAAVFLLLRRHFPPIANYRAHAPCVARRVSAFGICPACKFQLTRPLRGATCYIFGGFMVERHFNSHAPCGARPGKRKPSGTVEYFNSHAPCGARHPRFAVWENVFDFNSHAPCGARHFA